MDCEMMYENIDMQRRINDIIGVFCLFSKYLEIGAIDLIHKSQNAPVSYHTMLHSEQKCAHGAFWDLWHCSIILD